MDTLTKSFAIFEAGRHTAMSGAVLEITEADLQQTVDAYQPSQHEAPLVVGHPTHDAPAWGWVTALALEQGTLMATVRQVDPGFSAMVAAGRFKKISASFYTPDSPNNPAPGRFYLRHVGFLGAQPPAVKGLPDAQFRENENGVETVENEAPPSDTPRPAVTPKRPSPQQPFLTTEAAMSKTQDDPAATAMAGLKEKEAELTHKEAEFAEREQRLQEGEMALRQASISGFLDRLVREGRILPNQGPGLTAFMTSLNEAEQVAFSEPETGAPMIKTSSGAFIRTFLASLPVRVDYAERTAETGDKTDTIHFPIPDGFQVDPAGLKKHGQILAYANANNTDYLTAALAVS